MNTLDFIVIAIYIIGFLWLGFYFREQKDGTSYFLGSKSFGWFPLSMSTIATQLSAISFISAPAFVGMKQGGGMMWLSYELALPLAMVFLMIFLIPPLYKSGIVSVYEYLERRFDTSTRVLLSIVFQFSRAFATGIMIYTVALILSGVLEIEMWMTILVIGVITLVYSLLGGMKAVVYGDMIQMIILMLGIVICMFYSLSEIGGWSSFLEKVDTARLTAIDFSSWGFQEGEAFGFWPMLLGGFFLYVSYYGTDQSQVQRLFSASSLKTVKMTLLCNGLIRFPITLAYCIMGLIVGTYALTDGQFANLIPADKSDLMLPIFIRDYLPHGIIGLLIVAILSAAMSSLSSAINSLSAAFVEDVAKKTMPVEEKNYVWYSKCASLGWGIICIVLAFFSGDIADTVIEAINKIGSVFYGPILATFILAIGVKRVGALAANAGLLSGVAFNIYLWQFVPDVFWFWWNAIGAMVTFLMAYIVSFMVANTKAVEKQEISVSSMYLDGSSKKYAVILGIFFLIIIGVCTQIPSILGG